MKEKYSDPKCLRCNKEEDQKHILFDCDHYDIHKIEGFFNLKQKTDNLFKKFKIPNYKIPTVYPSYLSNNSGCWDSISQNMPNPNWIGIPSDEYPRYLSAQAFLPLELQNDLTKLLENKKNEDELKDVISNCYAEISKNIYDERNDFLEDWWKKLKENKKRNKENNNRNNNSNIYNSNTHPD